MEHISPYRPIVLDIGTGDGRFVLTVAREHPAKFYIGIDANTKPLEKPAMRATRKPAKGGLPNAMFVQAAVENLPEELDGIANEINVQFPWGSLLVAVAGGDAQILRSIGRIAANGCLLKIIIGIDPERDRAELERLGITEFTPESVRSSLVPKYASAGFECVEVRAVGRDEWAEIKTSWAQKLKVGKGRTVFSMVFRAV